VLVATRTEAASQVRTVLQAVKDRLAQPGGVKLNEATTRAHFLNPLLNALGYSGIDDLEFEHYCRTARPSSTTGCTWVAGPASPSRPRLLR
jgi:hypothetical protein